MPVDPSNNPHVRRLARKHANEEETDSRRARGEISCAECRRLKLKCDKKLPCSSCVRRGCPSICPNGSLSTGQGTRFVLADTTQLHAKIAEMGQRIRQLEDALAIFQSGVSNETHPLLRDDLLVIKFGPEKNYVPDKENTIKKEFLEPPIDAFGTMTIGDPGEAKYFGPSAGSETLFLAGAELEQYLNEEDTSPAISAEISALSSTFPFTIEGDSEKALESLFEELPPEPRAWSLCETYMEQAAWAFRPIKREELIEEILSPIYKAVKEHASTGVPCSNSVTSHKLAVLYLVFALGALVDLTLEPSSKEANVYYHLSRSCLSLRSVFDSPEVATVQAILLMGAYHGMAGKRYTMDSCWALTALGAKLAQSSGLHRDPARWNMDPKTVQRRRALFWELFSAEQFYSLALGRPPCIRLSYIDCEFPDDDEATVDEDGNTLKGYYRWKYEFAREIFQAVIELTLTAETPQYLTILELDRRLREKTLPAHLNVFLGPEDEHCTPSVYMKGCLLGQYRSVTLLYLHRSFFAQAMLDYPMNPLQSPFAPSFLAAYRCASGVIKSSLNHYDRFPELCGRWWGIWTHLFSAAIIVGSIVTRSPSSTMASSAFIELGLACVMFEKGAQKSRRARSGLAILYKMREKAFQVYSQFRSGATTIPNPILSYGKPDYGDDELALFGGQTRVLVSRLLSSKRRKAPPTSSSNTTVSSPSSTISERDSSESRAASTDPSNEVHPSLVEYLARFPPTSHPAESSALAQETSSVNASSVPHGEPREYMNYEPQTSSQDGWSDVQYSTNYTSTVDYGEVNPNLPYGMPFIPQNSTMPSGLIYNQSASPEGPLTDLGMMMAGESGMDEQWISFMRDSGLMEGNVNPTYSQPMPFYGPQTAGGAQPF